MRIGATDDLELFEPLETHGAQQAGGGQEIRTVVNIVDNPLEIVRVVSVRHLALAVRVLQLKLVHQLRLAQRRSHPRSHGGAEPRQETLVPVVLKVRVIDGYAAVNQVLHNAGIGQRV